MNKLKENSCENKKHRYDTSCITKLFMKNQEVKTKNITLNFCSDGILRIKIAKNAELDIDESKELVEKLNFNNQKWLVFADMRELKYQSKASRDYLASEIATQHAKAMALFANSSVSTFLGNLYILLSKPEIPTRLFTSEANAMKWLKKLID